MTLGDLAIGSITTVTRVGGERAFRRRMMELGLVPGTRVEIVRVAPLGDPIELRLRGCALSIRREEARCVDVAPEAASGRVTEAEAPIAPLRTGLPAAP